MDTKQIAILLNSMNINRVASILSNEKITTKK